LKEIKIPFNGWSLHALRESNKVCTSRSKCYGKPGNVFIVGDLQFELLGVSKLPLWFVKYCLFKQEGAKSPEEFQDVWDGIHYRKQFWKDPGRLVHVHFFKNIKNTGVFQFQYEQMKRNQKKSKGVI